MKNEDKILKCISMRSVIYAAILLDIFFGHLNIGTFLCQAFNLGHIKAFTLCGSTFTTGLASCLAVRVPRAVFAFSLLFKRKSFLRRHCYYIIRILTLVFNVIITVVDFILVYLAMDGRMNIAGINKITTSDKNKRLVRNTLIVGTSLILTIIIDSYITYQVKKYRD